MSAGGSSKRVVSHQETYNINWIAAFNETPNRPLTVKTNRNVELFSAVVQGTVTHVVLSQWLWQERIPLVTNLLGELLVIAKRKRGKVNLEVDGE
jgi:hypothetical protein